MSLYSQREPPRLEGVASSRALAQPSDQETGRRERSHSGRLLLRMPESLHAALADAAEREAVSLNHFITRALVAVLDGQTSSRKRPARGGGKWLGILLLANLVIVAAAGIVAILLLVSAWGS